MNNIINTINKYLTINTKQFLVNPNVKKRTDYLVTLLTLLPNKNWSYKNLSGNRSLPWSWVLANLNKDWSWAKLVYHKDATRDIIVQHYNIDNIYRDLDDNSPVNVSIINATSRPWDWDEFDTTKLCPNMIDDSGIYYLDDIQNVFTWRYIAQHSTMNWNWVRLSQYKSLTPEILTRYPHLPWRWDYISKLTNLTWKFVSANLDKNWNWTLLSQSHCLTSDIVLEYDDLPWDWNWVIRTLGDGWRVIIANLDKDLDWDYISEHLHCDIIEAHMGQIHTYLQWDFVAKNPSASIEFVLKYHDKLNFSEVSRNTFDMEGAKIIY